MSGDWVGPALAVFTTVVAVALLAFMVLVIRKMRQILRSAEDAVASVQRAQIHLDASRESQNGGGGGSGDDAPS